MTAVVENGSQLKDADSHVFEVDHSANNRHYHHHHNAGGAGAGSSTETTTTRTSSGTKAVPVIPGPTAQEVEAQAVMAVGETVKNLMDIHEHIIADHTASTVTQPEKHQIEQPHEPHEFRSRSNADRNVNNGDDDEVSIPNELPASAMDHGVNNNGVHKYVHSQSLGENHNTSFHYQHFCRKVVHVHNHHHHHHHHHYYGLLSSTGSLGQSQTPTAVANDIGSDSNESDSNSTDFDAAARFSAAQFLKAYRHHHSIPWNAGENQSLEAQAEATNACVGDGDVTEADGEIAAAIATSVAEAVASVNQVNQARAQPESSSDFEMSGSEFEGESRETRPPLTKRRRFNHLDHP